MTRQIDFNGIYNKVMEYKSCFIAAFLCYCVVYGFELTHFTLSIDEEFGDNFFQTIMLGRWGHGLLKHYILPEPYVPFFTTIISIAFLSIAAGLSAMYLKLGRTHSLAFVIMLASLPQLAYQLEFANQSDTIGVALIFSAASLIAMDAGGKIGWVAFIAATVLSLSIYQSVFLYAASLLCVRMALDVVARGCVLRDLIKKVAFYCLATLVSLAINAALSHLMQSVYSLPTSVYLDAMIGWGGRDVKDVIMTLAAMLVQYFSFENLPGFNSFPFVMLWIFIATISSLLFKKNAVLVALISLVTLCSAFILNVALGSWVPPRAMTQLPVVFAGLFIVAAVSCKSRKSSLLVSLIFLAAGSASSNKLFYSDYMARKADEQLGREMVSAIYNKYPSFNISSNPVFFYGSHVPLNSSRLPNSDVFGASFFEWDGGNNRRIYAYLETASIARFAKPDEAQVNAARELGKSLPSWPDRGSVEMHDGVVIVKLSDTLSPFNR